MDDEKDDIAAMVLVWTVASIAVSSAVGIFVFCALALTECIIFG